MKYQVAEHIFEILGAERFAAQMKNYAPFETDKGDDLLFRLTVHYQDATSAEGLDAWTSVLTEDSEEDMPRIEIYKHEDGRYLIRVAPMAHADICSEIVATSDFREAELRIYDNAINTRFCVDNAAMLLFAFSSAKLNTLEMHASVIKKEGKGYLFLGHSGTGKSTHSRQWMQAYEDAQLLNDDNPVVRIVDGEVRVYGSPWSGKTPCYVNDWAPVATFVMLRQAPENKIEQAKNILAYTYLLSSASGMKFNKGMMDGLHDTLSKIVLSLPIYLLNCLPNTDAAQMVYTTVNKA